jgi:hypothetical protein
MARRPNPGTPPDLSSHEQDGTPYKVGYGRPPLATRFRAGQSGNPRGRPRGAKNLSTLTREKLQAKVPVREGGRERRMSKGEIGVTKLVNRFAETGDPKLFLLLTRLLETGTAGEGSPSSAAGSPSPDEAQASDADILSWFISLNAANKGEEP